MVLLRPVCAVVVALIAAAVLMQPPAFASRCGDGIVDGDESCDDGNLHAGDCCSPTCRVEESYLGCAGACLCDTCADGIDNDEDGLVDAGDPECATLNRLQPVSLSAVRASGADSTIDSEAARGRVCVGSESAGRSLEDGESDVCDTASRLAAAASADVGKLPGAPVYELRVTAADPEIELSFDTGTSVLQVESVDLAPKSRLRLVGTPDSTVVVQVKNGLRLGAQAGIVLAGGLRDDRVLWNVLETSGEVGVEDGAILAGTLLAPQRSVRLGCDARVTGSLHAAEIVAKDGDCSEERGL